MFVISAYGVKGWMDGLKVYLARDSASSYPYWTTFLRNANEYSSIEETKNSWDINKDLLYNSIKEVDKDSIRIQEILYKDIERLKV